MAGNDNDDERKTLAQAIETRDSKYLAPVERCTAIYQMLHDEHPELTTWDLTCFAAYWLVTQSAEFKFLKPDCINLAKLVTFAHYNMNETGLASKLVAPEIEQSKESKDGPPVQA